MTIAKLRESIINCGNELHFTYNGKMCGLDQEVLDSIPTYEIWCGENLKTHSDFEDMIHDKFFDGQSILDLIDIVEFDFS